MSIRDFVIGEAPFNYRCHLNSVQKVKQGLASKVLLCFAIDQTDNSQCVHFINQLEHGKYQDNTWGWRYEDSDYYLIREIDPSEFREIWNVLSSAKEALVSPNRTWFEKHILRIKSNNFI